MGIRKACKNCNESACAKACQDDSTCQAYAFRADTGTCKTFTGCTQTVSSGKVSWVVLGKSTCEDVGEAPKPVETRNPTETSTLSPTEPPTNPPTSPTTNPPTNPPTN